MKTTIYFHSDKADMRNEFKDLYDPDGIFEPTADAIDEAARVGYEVEIEGDWDADTGKFMATHLMGTKLEKPTEI